MGNVDYPTNTPIPLIFLVVGWSEIDDEGKCRRDLDRLRGCSARDQDGERERVSPQGCVLFVLLILPYPEAKEE